MFKAKFAKYYDKVPFQEFLVSLTEDEKADVLVAIDKLLEFKNNNIKISLKLLKYLRDGIFELRVKHLTKISRGLYFFVKDQKLIFTNGFIKKTEKTPNSEIEKALKIMIKYKTEEQSGN
jgi:phage-related protein